MNAGEIAALLMAAAALITAVSNARNGKEMADKLRKQIESFDAERKKLLEHNEYQDALLVDREAQIVKLTGKIEQWQAWSMTVGRMMNVMQLEIGRLHQLRTGLPLNTTQPFPELQNDE